ncbi:MAG: amidohydrolase family protein [Labilithrix sp.]|nr:amidohydrolase family protein [Labilithrix sp.]
MLAGLHDIAIHDGEIAVVSAEPLRGRREVDAAEGWVMPGLIDTHIHFYDVHAVFDPESMQRFEENELPGRLDLFLQHGVTTIKSVGDPTEGILATRAKIAAGALRGPRLLATGCGITGRDGHPASTVFGSNPWARARFAGEVESVQQMRDLVRPASARDPRDRGSSAPLVPARRAGLRRDAREPSHARLRARRGARVRRDDRVLGDRAADVRRAIRPRG